MDGAIMVPLLHIGKVKGKESIKHAGSTKQMTKLAEGQRERERDGGRTSSDSLKSPAVRSKTQGSEGVAPGLSVATAETSVLEGLQAPVPTLPHHFPSPQPTHTCGQGPAPAPQLRPRSLRRLLHPCAL